VIRRRPRQALVTGLVACVLCAGPALVRAAPFDLSLAVIGGDPAQPELLLAQRAIDREWGPSDDSTYVSYEIPDWKSEGRAMGMSAAVPGTGQFYAGAPGRGLVFALIEIAGWTTRWLYDRRGDELQTDAAVYAGAPNDTTSRWSFDRYENATHQEAAKLRALYDGDRQVFYDVIAHDPNYLAGWSGPTPEATRQPYSDLRDNADNRLMVSRWASTGLWINHMVSAFDALRLARLHNIPLQKDTQLNLKTGWHRGRPTLMATVARKF
jgi:hypothetical protein